MTLATRRWRCLPMTRFVDLTFTAFSQRPFVKEKKRPRDGQGRLEVTERLQEKPDEPKRFGLRVKYGLLLLFTC